MKLMRRLVGGDLALNQLGNTVEVPLVDPSIFIERFARKLTLGGMQRKVQNTAMRLIQFMPLGDTVVSGDGSFGNPVLLSSSEY
eukprot:g17936.t1